jgi:hypothetical protein
VIRDHQVELQVLFFDFGIYSKRSDYQPEGGREMVGYHGVRFADSRLGMQTTLEYQFVDLYSYVTVMNLWRSELHQR